MFLLESRSVMGETMEMKKEPVIVNVSLFQAWWVDSAGDHERH